MVSSVWRFAHLALAVLSFSFLIVASVTGVILAIDTVNEKIPAYKNANFDELTLSQTLPKLREVYPEIIELSIDHNQFVTIEGFDDEGNDFKFIADPVSGEKKADPIVKSEFIQWITSLHRSFFLHETGRFIVGIVSFLLMLIAVSGIALVVKQQQGFRKFFAKINREFFEQYFHIAAGRLLLLPILIISITGTFLFLVRFDVIQKEEFVPTEIQNKEAKEIPLKDFPVFKEIYLKDVKKIGFPFADDPEEFFKIKLKDKELLVNQITGQIVSETKYPVTTVLETLSLDLHTGRTNSIWAILLAIASLNILFFIYSGFVITFKRKAVKILNKFKPDEAEYIILVGSEKGSTLHFADKILKQLIANGKTAYLTNLNDYNVFESAKQLIIFTSTYGSGDAPVNANQFEKLLEKFPQTNKVNFSVVGFGSIKYQDFCAFAYKVHQLLADKSWANPLFDVYTVNDKSANDFISWVKDWSKTNEIPLTLTPAVYKQKTPKLKSFKVLAKTNVSNDNQTFQITLKPNSRTAFQSGDLLAIYPDKNQTERFYSIAKIKNNIHLVVKLHENGLSSQFLHDLSVNGKLQAAVISNKSFHFPKKASKIIMIANGTGIAPFLGLIKENKSKIPTHLYAGFRNQNDTTSAYKTFLEEEIKQKKLTGFNFVFSREDQSEYVMNSIERDAELFAKTLENKGIIMICGSLNMQKDVEQVLDRICLEINNKPLNFYKENNQIKTDCY
ncbi:PepSY domain-containing protein [Paenimyroides baculatum]|uniref:NADPH--hemoprotein reductase n=1 Tax=Paenimyroides baculatum TaxID=2608000 RepID=A0A5M6CRV8_9FLAO|nr:PepSY domain-containing protein [Paenimyroides baculatum]KAA5538048.1 FAD-binding oxidoreductase [Paenimyroides baculatum]